MLKAQDVLNEISKDSTLMAEFKKTQSFGGLYELCQKVEPNITELEVEEGLKELITENLGNTVSPLSNEELAAVAGGSMDFNKTKALALSALMLTGVSSMTMFSNNAYAAGTPETTSISQKAQTENDDQETLDKALLQAVLEGDKTLVEKLVNQGANINESYYVKVDVKFISGESGGSPPNSKEKSIYRNALGLAAITGQIELVRLLVEKGADINNNAGSGTALEFAAENGHLNVVKYLLDNGAKSHQEDYALSCAIDYNQTDVVKLLLEKGANADKKDFWTKFSLLMKAAREGNADIVKLLLKHGASVFVKTSDGKTALDYAKTDEIKEILKEAAKNAGFFEKTIAKVKNLL